MIHLTVSSEMLSQFLPDKPTCAKLKLFSPNNLKTLIKLLAIITIIGSLALSPTFASQTDCPEHFAGGQAPDLINQKLSTKTQEVCYSGYALKHSGVTRTPLYASEHLTRDRLAQGKGLKRKNQFHADENVPQSERAELHHYARSGYDRGHVAPSADMFDEQSQYECFSLANMVPQVPKSCVATNIQFILLLIDRNKFSGC